MKADWIKKLTITYWVIVGIVFLLVAFAFYWSNSRTFLYDQSDRTIGESIAILTMLLGIPISLKLYHVYTREKLPSEKDEKRMIQHIVKWFLLRIGIVLVALVLNFIAYVVFGSQSAFLCVIICLVFLVFFCKPNRNDLTFLLKTDHEEKTCE